MRLSPSAAPVRPRGAPAQEPWVGVLAGLVLTVLSAGVVSSSMLEQPVTAPAPLATEQAFELEQVVVPSVAISAQVVAAPAPAPAPASAPAPAPAPPAPAPAAAEPAAAPAPAPADPLCSGAGWQQRRGEAALASLRRPADAAAFRISFEPGRSGVIGLAALREGRMQVFVRSCDALSPSLLAHVVAHELGHLVDADRMDAELRAQWMALRGIPTGTPWYGCDACSDFATPAGDFAEVYAQWQTGARGNRSQLAPAPSPGALAELAARFF